MTREELLHLVIMLKKNSELFEKQEDLNKDDYYKKFAIDGKENIWKSILDTIPMTVFINGISTMLWINKYCEVDSGYTQEEWLNFTNEERMSMFHPDDMKTIYDLGMKFIEMKKDSKDFFKCEYRIKRKDGTWFWNYSTYSYILDPLTGEFKLLGTGLNIQNLKDKEDEILRLNAELEKLLNKEREYLREREEFHKKEIEAKQKELNRLAVMLSEKRYCLINLKRQAKALSIAGTQKLKNLSDEMIKDIDNKLRSEMEWSTFEIQFENVNPHFMKNLIGKYPDLTITEMRLSSLIKSNLSTKLIASLLNLSTRTIENHRLNIRKKMNLNVKDQLIKVLETI